MAPSHQASSRLFFRNRFNMLRKAGAGATLVGQEAIEGEYFAALAFVSELTGAGLTKLEIIVSDDAAGVVNPIVVKDSGAVVADAVGDQVRLECNMAEAKHLAEVADPQGAPKYIGARVTLDNAADAVVVTYVHAEGRSMKKDKTPATVIA